MGFFLAFQDEKICFIMDESNVLDSSFLERMNTLLANGEVRSLFVTPSMILISVCPVETAQLYDKHDNNIVHFFVSCLWFKLIS